MDKNIKAELWTLRNEVMTNLKNIEGLVGKIDTKLAEEDESSCLSRCPEIAKLLEICNTVDLHPNTAEGTVTQFRSLVTRVTERLSIVQIDRYADSMAELINICKKIDSKVGKLPAESPMEALWESRFPGVREQVEEYLEEKDPVTNQRIRPVDLDDQDVKNALDKLNRRLAQRDPIYTSDLPNDADPNLAPEWAKGVDTKSGQQIWKEAAEWDEDAHMLFGQMWNQTAQRRIDLMEEVIRETIQHVTAYNYYNERVTIKSHNDVKDLMARYQSLEKAKEDVIDILSGFGDILKEMIDDKENVGNWLRYYDWNDRMMRALEEVAKLNTQGHQVVSNCNTMMRFLSIPKEKQIWDPMVIDPQTFELVPMNMPIDKLEAYRELSYRNYMRDLERAYAWEAKKKETSETSEG